MRPGLLSLPALVSLLAAGMIPAVAGPPLDALPDLLEDAAVVRLTAGASLAAPPGCRSRLARLGASFTGPDIGTRLASGARIRANWFDDVTQVVRVRQGQSKGAGRFVCVGEVEGRPGSQAILAIADGAMVGFVAVPGEEAYQIEYCGEGVHRVQAVDRTQPLPCGLERIRSLAGGEADTVWDAASEAVADGKGMADASLGAIPTVSGEALVQGAPPTVDFLVVYSPRALAGAGGEAGMQALIDFFLAEAQTAYANSQLNIRWNVVHRELVDYTDSGNLVTDWNLLRNTGDGALDEVHTLRDRYAADLVMLIVEVDEQSYAGVAAANFTVFRRPVIASGRYVVTHEVGHLFGAGHDRLTCEEYKPGNCGALRDYSYGHRFVANGTTYTTVMSYEPGTAIPYFSNPAVGFLGVPTGVAAGAPNAADNARTLREQAPAIAAQRTVSSRFALSSSNARVSETGGWLEFEVRRTGAINSRVSVWVRTADQTAKAGSDYRAYARQIGFAPGEIAQTDSLAILDDPHAEGAEQFRLYLDSPSAGSALAEPSTAVVTIDDDEPVIRVATELVMAAEAEGRADVRVQRTGRTDQPAAVRYTVAAGSAAAAADFEPASGRLDFAPGQTERVVTVVLRDDTERESDETCVVTLHDAQGAALLPAVQTTVRILDGQREGSVDRAFASALRLNDVVETLAVRPDGRILCGGFFMEVEGRPRVALVQLLPDGRVDPAFPPAHFEEAGSQGPRLLPAAVALIRLTDGGEMYVSGAFTAINGVPRNRLARLRDDGSVDLAFACQPGPDGSVAQLASSVGVIEPLAGGQVIIGGSFRSVSGWPSGLLARLNADGSPDRDFQATPRPQAVGVSAVVRQADGRLIVGGMFFGFDDLARQHLIRLQASGRADPTFAPLELSGPVSGLAWAADGGLLVAGSFASPSPGKILKLRTDGTVDTTFQASPRFDAPIGSLLAQPDGRLFVSGGFTAATGRKGNYLARLNPNGSTDAAFDIGSGPDDYIRALAIQPHGALVIGGAFQAVNGTPAPFLARLRSDDLRPALGAPKWQPDGRLSLRLTGRVSGRYVIEGSADLREWTGLGTTTLVSTSVDWVEPAPGAGAMRYYRARFDKP